MTIHNTLQLNLTKAPRNNLQPCRPFGHKKIYTLADLPSSPKDSYNGSENQKLSELCNKVDLILKLLKKSEASHKTSSFCSKSPSNENVNLIICKSQEAIERSERAINSSSELIEKSRFSFTKSFFFQKLIIAIGMIATLSLSINSIKNQFNRA